MFWISKVTLQFCSSLISKLPKFDYSNITMHYEIKFSLNKVSIKHIDSLQFFSFKMFCLLLKDSNYMQIRCPLVDQKHDGRVHCRFMIGILGVKATRRFLRILCQILQFENTK